MLLILFEILYLFDFILFFDAIAKQTTNPKAQPHPASPYQGEGKNAAEDLYKRQLSNREHRAWRYTDLLW
jgi:hypothetical protein